MAFATVVDADTKNGTVTTNSSSWTLTYPTNIAAGDLLLLFLGLDGFPVPITLPAGWAQDFQPLSQNYSSNGASTVLCAYKFAVGSEAGTFTLGLSASEQGGWRIFRVTGHYGSSQNPNVAGNAQGATQFPDPPSLNPSQWDVEDTLWFAACGVDTARTISVYPLAGRNTADVSGGSGGATLGLCSTTSAAASLDPGTFTISASDDWGAITVAVRPAAAVAAATRKFQRASVLGV